MRPYKPSGALPFGTFLGLILAGLVAGAAAGAALFALEYYVNFYLVLVFPLFAGAIVGFVLSQVARAGKARNPVLVGLVALLSGVVIMGTYHLASYYIGFRGDARQVLIEDGNDAPTENEVDAVVDRFLVREVGEKGLTGYWAFIAEEGFSITRATSSSSTGIDLQGELVYGYWIVEVVVAAFMSITATVSRSREPFDENTGQWYGAARALGYAPIKQHRDIKRALKDGDYRTAGSLLSTTAPKGSVAELSVRSSADPTMGDHYVQFAQVVNNRRSPIIRGLVSTADLKELTDAISTTPVLSDRR